MLGAIFPEGEWEEMIKLIGMWLLSDSIFSLRTYWGKEDLFCQGIRWTRLILSGVLIIWG
jgi:hypothetical protein